MIPTKLDVFALQFDVDTPRFLKECCENCEGGMYGVCYNIFKNLLGMVSVRAIELNDPILNVLMLRLNLYDLDDGGDSPNISNNPELRNKVIAQIKNEIEQTHKIQLQ